MKPRKIHDYLSDGWLKELRKALTCKTFIVTPSKLAITDLECLEYKKHKTTCCRPHACYCPTVGLTEKQKSNLLIARGLITTKYNQQNS